MRALLAGYCNDRPRKTGIPGEGGGYSFWRCALQRGHDGDHRSKNYTWDQNGKTEYAPMREFPCQPWDRTATSTIRQTRNHRRWQAEQSARRKAERLARGEAY
jgi:hypothetical protein